MKHIFYCIIIVLTLLSTSCLSLILNTKAEEPNSDIKIDAKRYIVNRQIQISKIETTVLDSVLNLFKNVALIRIELEGIYQKDKYESVYFNEIRLIEEAFVSHIPNLRGECSITLSLYPTFTDKQKRKDETEYKVNSTEVHFKTKLEYQLKSCCWGTNKVVVNINGFKDEFEIYQKK